jgi:hypothetical protein
MEERRGNSIDRVLVEIGSLKEKCDRTNVTVESLNTRVGIQNGRVGKLEKWQSYLMGMGTILVLLVIPVVLKVWPLIMKSIYSN